MNNLSTLYKKTFELAGRVESLAIDTERKDVKDSVRKIVASLEATAILVVVVGGFKQGKSSLVQALLGEKDLVPVADDIASNVPIVIRDGPRPSYSTATKVNGKVTRTPISREDVARLGSEGGNKRNVEEILLIDVELPSPMLEGGVCLVDTPGVAGIFPEHAQTVREILPRADIVLFVNDVSQVLRQADIEFLEDYVWPNCKEVVYALTKSDLVADVDQLESSYRSAIAEARGQSAFEVPLHVVSSTLMEKYLVSSKERDLRGSGFTGLKGTLEDRTVAIGSRYVFAALSALKDLIDSIGSNANMALLAKSGEWETTVQDLEKAREKLDDLKHGASRWRPQLSSAIRDLHAEIEYLIARRISKIKLSLRDRLAKGKPLPKEKELSEQFLAQFEDLRAEAESISLRRSSEIASDLRTATGLELRTMFNHLSFDTASTDLVLEAIMLKETPPIQRIMKAAQAIAPKVHGVAALASPLILGGIAFGAPVTGFVAVAIFAAATIKAQLTEVDREDRERFEKKIVRGIDDASSDLQITVNRVLASIEHELERDLREELTQARELAADLISQLQTQAKAGEGTRKELEKAAKHLSDRCASLGREVESAQERLGLGQAGAEALPLSVEAVTSARGGKA